MSHVMIFAVLLSVMLLTNGTGALFCALVGTFVVLAGIGFNLGGGLSRPSGTYVFFFSTLAVIVGLVVKVVIWEPADSLLHSPLITMGAYTGGMLSMLCAVYIGRRVARKEGWLQNMVSTEGLRLAAIGCVVGGVAIPLLAQLALSTGSRLLAPISTASLQINRFLPMSIVLGVTYEVKSSGGRRSINASVLLGWGLLYYFGVMLGYSKEALFGPPLLWVASAAALRYSFSWAQLLGGVVALLIFGTYLVPYCQYGRGLANQGSMWQQTQVSMQLLTHLGDVRAKYKASEEGSDRAAQTIYFFNNPEGIFDRLQMIGIDDALVTVTETNGPYGLSPYMSYLSSVIPRFLWKDKPFIMMGNLFAHEIGLVSEDTTTGISFSPVAEVYHEAKWFGVFVVAPIMWFLLFVILDSLCGDVRKSPWGLLVLFLLAHIAPEGMMQGVAYMMSYGSLIVIIVAFFSAYVMPLLSSLVMPPRRNAGPAGTVRSVPRPAFANVTGTPGEP